MLGSIERQLEDSCCTFFSELKYDGMAVALHYDEEDGTLRSVLTRGDGVRGELISVPLVLDHVSGIPSRVLLDSAHVEVRGELVMRNAEFAKLCQSPTAVSTVPPANPRNAVAGMVRSGIFRGARLDFVAYGSSLLEGVTTHSELRDQLLGMGFQVCQWGQRHHGGAQVLESARRWMTGEQAQNEWPSDGLVFKVDNVAKSQALGFTRHHPRSMVAFKWGSGNVVQSVIREIEWSVDGRGFARPVARFDPVTVDGALLEKASLYNWEYVSQHGLKVGSHVGVERAGGVIPRIILVESPATTSVPPPETCSCELRSPLLIVGQHLQCANHDSQCPQKIAYRAAQLAEILHIPGIGPAVSKRLQREGLLNGFSDWSLLELTPAAMMERGWTEASARRICGEISSAVERITFLDVLVMLFVPGMGAAAWKNVARRFPSWQALRSAKEEQLSQIPGVGASRSKSIVELLSTQGDTLERELIGRWKLPTTTAAVEVESVDNDNSNNNNSFPLEGKRICITGRLSKPRAQIAGKLRIHGASVTSSLSSKTSFLLCGTDPSQEDVAKAERLRVPSISEIELFSMLPSINVGNQQ